MKLTTIALLLLMVSCGQQQGINGINGLNGTNGQDGIDGINGQDGQDAQLETIKFCPDLEDVYPKSFPEYGLCIGNKVYAVYSTNNTAFLSYLTPGTYITTSNGINCRFQVVVDSCEVINL